MKKIIFIVIGLIIFSNLVFCQLQPNLDIFQSIDYKKSENILRDSLMKVKDIWENFDIDTENEFKDIELIVLPTFNLSKNANKYESNRNLLDYIVVNNDMLSALVISNDSLLGYIKAYHSPIYSNHNNQPKDTSAEELINFLYRRNDTIIGYTWTLFEGTTFDKSSKDFAFWNRVYHIMQEYDTKYFFTFTGMAWDFWFLKDYKLMVYNIHLNKVVKEEELVARIRKKEVDGIIRFIIDYKFNNE